MATTTKYLTRCAKFATVGELPEGCPMHCCNCRYVGDKDECPYQKPSCLRCVYGYTCSFPDREERGDCLDEWKYKHFKYGEPMIRLRELQWSGAINIVLGGEGEHEVNARWSIDDAYGKLSHVCEQCGGLCWKEKENLLIVDKPHGGAFSL